VFGGPVTCLALGTVPPNRARTPFRFDPISRSTANLRIALSLNERSAEYISKNLRYRFGTQPGPGCLLWNVLRQSSLWSSFVSTQGTCIIHTRRNTLEHNCDRLAVAIGRLKRRTKSGISI